MTKSTAGLPLTIALQIPTYWTPEQAFAVFQLVDELREAIWQWLRAADPRPISRSHPPGPGQSRSSKTPAIPRSDPRWKIQGPPMGTLVDR